MVRTILETAEARKAPVILMCLPMDLTANGMIYLPRLIRAVAEYHQIPLALHLDHATDLDLVKAAIDSGFTSVMVDGSSLSFAENVKLTGAAVELAHPQGVSVEGELGHVGGMDLDDKQCVESVATEPDEVTRFVAETAVDALAVSIGTAHGVYRSLPHLAIDRLGELNAASPVPLVLHGGSGTPDSQIRAAVQHGICKLNIFADNRIAMARGMVDTVNAFTRPDPLPGEMFGLMRRELAKVVLEKIQLLSAENQAWEEGAVA
jgi:fructose-bisphosphate aldolase class II